MRLPVPPVLRRLSSDEYDPLPWRASDLQALASLREEVPDTTSRLRIDLATYALDPRGNAATLRAIDAANGGGFYDVPLEAAWDLEAARAIFDGGPDGFVMDVQNHLVHPARWEGAFGQHMTGFFQAVDPERWPSVDPMMISAPAWAALVFGASETDIAVLTSPPGRDIPGESLLSNPEIAAVREAVERYAPSRRLLTHTIVHPNVPGEMEAMAGWSRDLTPNGWKTYTHFEPDEPGGGWYFDDDQVGLPFLERVRELGPKLVAVHKGCRRLFANDGRDGKESPRDIGPAARMFPDIRFLVYHSGYHLEVGGAEEGPYTEATKHHGVNRLVTSLRDAGVGPGANVYAELGTIWFLMIRRPAEAAHILGKLLLAVGEDRILWGTDCIWYGSPQPLIEAFRAFRIPQRFQDEYGYPPLTSEAKRKILGLNAVEAYDLGADDVARARADSSRTWLPEVRDDLRRKLTGAAVGIAVED